MTQSYLRVMTLPRKLLIDTASTCYYHCTSRCVRQAYLCGVDHQQGRNFEHRRAWIEARLNELAGIFAIDLCAYAVMSNHYHATLHINLARQASWSSDEVVARWQKLYRVPAWFGTADELRVAATVEEWRNRLGSISWFMRCVNEPLARMANREDGCKGRFWEGRFSSQALLDESALLKCMAYVDLNPIRAGIADRPETSHYTSVMARISRHDSHLAPMRDEAKNTFCLPVTRREYLSLVDWTGRQQQTEKRGRIDESLPPIVERLQRSTPRDWIDEMANLGSLYHRAIGNATSLATYRDFLGQKRLRGIPV